MCFTRFPEPENWKEIELKLKLKKFQTQILSKTNTVQIFGCTLFHLN